VRKEFYKSAASQLTLLKDIGISQMEKELENQVKYYIIVGPNPVKCKTDLIQLFHPLVAKDLNLQ
jgi:hypothetical protein